METAVQLLLSAYDSSMEFSGYYSDVITPVKTRAVITLHDDRMMVRIPSHNESQEWFYGMIRKKKENSSGVVIEYKSTLRARLEIDDPQFISQVHQLAPYASFAQPVLWYKSRNGLYVLVAIKALTIAAAILLFIFAVPLLINISVDRISEETEASIGNKIHNTILNGFEVDTQQTRLVNDFFSKLKPPADTRMKITVVDSRVQNAFTLPGNDIVIENGVFEKMDQYPEIVALLGHESGHAVGRDPLKMLCRQSATSVLLLTMVGNINGVVTQILSNASNLKNLSYSRSYETAADRFDYEWMRENQVNPQGIIDLLKNFDRGDQASVNTEFLSSHPSAEQRIGDVREWIKKDHQASYPTDPALEAIWQSIKMAATPKHTH